MCFDTDLKASAELKREAKEKRRAESELNKLQDRAAAQSVIVRKASQELDRLVNGGAWDKLKDPEAIRDAKRKCAEASDRLKDERELLDAINTAIDRVKADVREGAQKIEHMITATIQTAALKSQDEIRETIQEAVEDFIACSVAVEGPIAISGAQYELEVMVKDISFLKRVDERIGSAQRNLREQVYH